MDVVPRRYTHLMLFFVGLTMVVLSLFVQDPFGAPATLWLGVCFIVGGISWIGSAVQARQMIAAVSFASVLAMIALLLYWLFISGFLNELTIVNL